MLLMRKFSVFFSWPVLLATAEQHVHRSDAVRRQALESSEINEPDGAPPQCSHTVQRLLDMGLSLTITRTASEASV